MDSDPKTHQVIIVGGGVAGLTLALMLQHLNIDYILLEAYGTVTPSSGASIALLSNGLRILDQMGLYDDLVANGDEEKTRVIRTGQSVNRLKTLNMNCIINERHGYKEVFMSRHLFLCVLYDHIINKRRILVDKKVRSVQNYPDKAIVYTEDGSLFEGQVVVGADGVRSTVRKEMWRNADKTEPDAIPENDRNNISCEYACVFGTAASVPDIDPGSVIAVCGRKTAVGCLNGRDEMFLFWFWMLPPEHRSISLDDIPRFTDEDKRRELERGGGTILADSGLRLAEVAKNFRRTGITALPHFILQRWHYGRIFILGDAAHKFNPFIGQGGNSCIESCAALVNALQEHFSPQSMVAADWPLPVLTEIFVSVEKKRVHRLSEMIEMCQNSIRATAWESWKAEFQSRFILPFIPTSKLADFESYMIRGGLRLQGFKPPRATNKVPYEDEVDQKIEQAPLSLTKVVRARISTPIVILVAVLTTFFLI